MNSRVLVLVAFCLASCGNRPGEVPEPPRELALSHGAMAFEAVSDGVTLWARTSRPATVQATVLDGMRDPITAAVETMATSDNTAAIEVRGLEAGRDYEYVLRAESGGETSTEVRGRFRTPPPADDTRPIRLAWSGDLSGQNVCRDARRGFPITGHIIATRPDFFVALGDMIYADQTCEARGRFGNEQVAGDFEAARTIESFWAHWRYNRADAGMQALAAMTSMYALWDDHEVIDDFARDSHRPLVAIGRRGFLDYNPIAGPGAGEPRPLYRSVRWGKHLELIILDNRSYRDANDALDNGEQAKTMLGAEQLAWLVTRLRESDATWKIIASSVPISIPTGADPPDVARDGWADHGSGQGFERELRAIISAARPAANMVWITTDVHFASVFRYQFAPGQSFHEVVVGPMNAGLFPKKEVDDSFAPERLFFHGPDDPDALSYEAALAYMTFGTAEIDDAGNLTLRIVNADGVEIFALALRPGAGAAAAEKE